MGPEFVPGEWVRLIEDGDIGMLNKLRYREFIGLTLEVRSVSDEGTVTLLQPALATHFVAYACEVEHAPMMKSPAIRTLVLKPGYVKAVRCYAEGWFDVVVEGYTGMLHIDMLDNSAAEVKEDLS